MPSAPQIAPDLDAWLAAAVEIATKAAEMVRDGQAARWSQSAEDGPVTEQKKNRVDLVTETDQKVEQYIQNEVKQRFGSQGHLL